MDTMTQVLACTGTAQGRTDLEEILLIVTCMARAKRGNIGLSGCQAVNFFELGVGFDAVFGAKYRDLP
jgi:hypothetical protein